MAPRGRTPVFDTWDRRDRLSAISCVTLSPVVGRPGLYFHLLPTNKTVPAVDIVAFLRALRQQLRGPFTVVWDRHGIHSKAKVVQAFLADHPDIVAEDLPAYAPELNPDEWVWGWTKYGRLSNLAAWDTEELWGHIMDALIDLKYQPKLLHAFIQEAGMPLAA